MSTLYRALARRYGWTFEQIDLMTVSRFRAALESDDGPGAGVATSWDEVRRMGWMD